MNSVARVRLLSGQKGDERWSGGGGGRLVGSRTGGKVEGAWGLPGVGAARGRPRLAKMNMRGEADGLAGEPSEGGGGGSSGGIAASGRDLKGSHVSWSLMQQLLGLIK